MIIWILIPVFNRIEYTLQCLATLHRQAYTNFTVVICDHGSTDGTSEKIRRQYPDVVLLTGSNSLWWTGAINMCVNYALEHANSGDLLLTLNNDTELPPDYLQQLINCNHQYPDSIITSVIHDIKTGQLVDRGYRQNWLLATSYALNFENHHLDGDDDVVEVTHASGRGTLFPVSVFRQLGLYDEKHLPHYAADYDFTFKAARAGYRIYISKNCKVYSYVEATGMTSVLSRFTVKSFINYFTGMRSPANLKARWWYGWNNCPKSILPIYMAIDFLRVTGSYCRYFLLKK